MANNLYTAQLFLDTSGARSDIYLYSPQCYEKETEMKMRIDYHAKFSEEPLKNCPSCHKDTLVRVIGGSGLVFKGSGFYQTDYKKTLSDSEEKKGPAKKEEKKEDKGKE